MFVCLWEERFIIQPPRPTLKPAETLLQLHLLQHSFWFNSKICLTDWMDKPTDKNIQSTLY